MLICPNCKQPIDEESKFCSFCGTAVRKTESSDLSDTAAVPATPGEAGALVSSTAAESGATPETSERSDDTASDGTTAFTDNGEESLRSAASSFALEQENKAARLNGWIKNDQGVWEKVSQEKKSENPDSASYDQATAAAPVMWQNHENGPSAPEAETASESNGKPFNSLGEWVLNIFLASLPIAGLVLMLVWSFSENTNPEKKNWARANLIWTVVYWILLLIFIIFMVNLSISYLDYYLY